MGIQVSRADREKALTKARLYMAGAAVSGAVTYSMWPQYKWPLMGLTVGLVYLAPVAGGIFTHISYKEIFYGLRD